MHRRVKKKKPQMNLYIWVDIYICQTKLTAMETRTGKRTSLPGSAGRSVRSDTKRRVESRRTQRCGTVIKPLMEGM